MLCRKERSDLTRRHVKSTKLNYGRKERHTGSLMATRDLTRRHFESIYQDKPREK